MIMRRFTHIPKKILALCLLALGLARPAQACVDERSDHNYYMFSVFNRDHAEPAHLYQMAAFWQRYAGDDSAPKLYFYDTFHDDIVKVARRKKDTEMQAYLKQFDAYRAASEVLAPEAWRYPTRQERQRALTQLTAVATAARAYRGSRLKSQYVLLRMRVNMLRGLDQQNATLWTTIAQRLPSSPWREAMRSIYARTLWKSGHRQQALDIYAQQGDMSSVRVLARGYRNLAGIEATYQRNPNSPMLTYLVQDFVNNCQQTIDSRAKDGFSREWVETLGAKVVYEKEAMDFVRFADRVVGEGKTTTPCLWRSATAMIHYLYGRQAQAWTEAQAAVGLAGTQRMKDNARAIRLLVSTAQATVPDGYSEYLVGEFRWLNEQARHAVPVTTATGAAYPVETDRHYIEVQERVAYRALRRHFERLGQPEMAVAMYGMMDAYDRSFLKDQQDERYISRYLYSSEYAWRLDSLSAQQLAAYYRFITADHADAFERWVCQSLYRDTNFFHDLIGTKYLAEGQFAEAATWLKAVTLPFINDQAISFYAARRSPSVPFWFQRQRVNDDTLWEADAPYADLKANPKLQFAQEMARLTSQYGLMREGADRDRLAYDLAVRCYQASCYGDCWYLTHYGKSVADSARVGQADYAAMAQRYLAVSSQSTNLQLRYHSLYALAFIDFDPWMRVTYDEDYNPHTVLMPQTVQYKALASLLAFAKEHPGEVDSYTTHCDVLRAFEAATATTAPQRPSARLARAVD